jgi:amino acid adenylation domain-containing protein
MPDLETVLDHFSVQVRQNAEGPVLKFREHELNYRQLNEVSNQVANYLAIQGVKTGTLVPICLQNPMDMVIGILGILKAGGIYVPIDSEFPTERIKYILSDTAAEIIISDNNCENLLTAAQGSHIILAENNWSVVKGHSTDDLQVSLSKDDLVYVIYTSGSTGMPKGVMIKHGSLVHYLDGLYKSLPENNYRSYGLGVSFAADSIIPYLFGGLTRGATLHLFSKDDYNSAEYMHGYFETHEIDCFAMFPSHWKSLLLNGAELMPRKLMMLGGETLYTEMLKNVLHSQGSDCVLINHYGPTEATVAQLMHVVDPQAEYGTTIPIGKPFTGADIYIANENGEVAKGEIGELYIGGKCVSAGYLNKPELTAERFVKNSFRNTNDILYRTGDMVRRLPDGNVEFLGRVDDQVKIRGFRIELGEIESVLQKAPGVTQCVVLAKDGNSGDKRLVAYVVCGGAFDKIAISSFLEERLPQYMVPKLLVHLQELPLMSNGKVDKKALPNPDASTLLHNAYAAPVSDTETTLSELWKEVLGVQRAGADDNFFELGGTSLLALKVVSLLKSRHNISLAVVKIYQFPKIKDLASFIDGKIAVKKRRTKAKAENADVAIIGMSGRFPGADSIEELWTILKEGKETTTFFKDDELDASISPVLKNNADYVKARGVVRGAKEFDAAFFGINPKHAELMDPQQRIFLEIAWETLERSGYMPGNYEGTMGVFAGVQPNTYYTNNVLSHSDLVENVGSMQIQSLNDKDYVASRTAYTLDLKGPAINVQSACSTSLVAVAQAVHSIRSGQCDMALAGGASIAAPINAGHLYEEGAILSADGHCKPFDAHATGTIFSDGAGVVLLKNLEEAIKDGDIIYGVVKGVGLSNDGGGKGSFSAPSAEGQAAAISMAIEDAGISPADIGYIEAHGTATPLGDPIELEGLNMAFGEQDRNQYCAIGSVKSNFGHLTVSAGIAGLIKACLALHHKQIPASINYDTPNPHINFTGSPFYVNTQLSHWASDKTRYAGVSSFGVGGTNAHIILSEGITNAVSTAPSPRKQLLAWSAKSENALTRYGVKLANHLAINRDLDLADVAYTLLTSRQNFEFRKFIVAADASDAITQLSGATPSSLRGLNGKAQNIVFMFPGQGDQYVNMGKSLYASENVFRTAMDECATLLQADLQENILDIIYPGEVNAITESKIRHTRYSQPTLFSIGYALGKLWMSWGIKPSAFVGHSIGEFVAACFAGVFSLKDALTLIAARGKMMDALPGGSMLSVRLPYDEAKEYLSADVALAAVNSPQLCVLAGTEEVINDLSKALDEKGVLNKVLPTSHAFHSHMMDVAVGPFEDMVRNIQLNAPLLPIASSVTGEWLTAAEATDAGYWARHMRAPVLFGKAVQKLIDAQYGMFLEAGPGKSVATLARQQAAGKPIVAISSFEKEESQLPSDRAILKALGDLWVNGCEPNWDSFYRDEVRAKVNDLPTYAFDRQTYWVDAIPAQAVAQQTTPVKTIQEAISPANISGKQQLTAKIKDILEAASGIDMTNVTDDMSFIEIGLDSLLLTQVALLLKKQFSVPVTFRQLNEELGRLDLLAEYLGSSLPNDTALVNVEKAKPGSLTLNLSAEEEAEIKKPFGAIARIDKQSTTLGDAQQAYLSELTEKYNLKTKGSKDYTQQHRSYMADPRVVSGFKPATKELAYSIVMKRSKGSRFWDVDGNEYIDALNAFGANMLGYQPEFLKEALLEQVENGYEIGPQHELAGDVCKLICELTNFDRAGLCNTGSEAVLGAMRIARTVTGRSIIVAFSGAYHGITDEVIARGSKKLTTYPAAPGIMPEAVQNMLILEYGTEESLRIIEERAHEIAAVLVEPVQSRRPEFQPVSFLKKLRHITKAAGTVLIFDEVVSGFRFHVGGVQAMFGVKADIATYGKVIGGGMAIGVIAGQKEFMDALDGGWWQYGDSSIPEVGVTYFAGTFVRHPLALATTKASLEYFKKMGPSLQEGLNGKGQYMADTINAICRKQNVPMCIVQFGSLWRIKMIEEFPYSELFYVLMRYKGVHMIEGFPCYITTAQTDADLEYIIRSFEESLVEMKEKGFIPYHEHVAVDKNSRINIPPMPFAKLGKDKDGNPAWFISDELHPGKYLQILNEA